MIITKTIKIKAKEGEYLDITEQVQNCVSDSKLKNGAVTVFVVGSTGAVSTIEYEPGLLKDVPGALEKLAPSNEDYEHNKTWGCDNGYSHVRATLLGPSLTVPIVDEKLTLGTWQQIVFMNFDTRDREREIVLQMMGE